MRALPNNNNSTHDDQTWDASSGNTSCSTYPLRNLSILRYLPHISKQQIVKRSMGSTAPERETIRVWRVSNECKKLPGHSPLLIYRSQLKCYHWYHFIVHSKIYLQMNASKGTTASYPSVSSSLFKCNVLSVVKYYGFTFNLHIELCTWLSQLSLHHQIVSYVHNC